MNMSTFYLLVVCFMFVITTAANDSEEEVCCGPRFLGDLKSCPDFDNADVNLGGIIMGFRNNDEEEGGLRIAGSFDVLSGITDDCELELKVLKWTDLGKEYMYGAVIDFCSNLNKKDAPWTPLVESANISECPVEQSTYTIQEVVVNLDFLDRIMKHEMCGEYEIEISMTKGVKQILCYIFGLEIYEKSEN